MEHVTFLTMSPIGHLSPTTLFFTPSTELRAGSYGGPLHLGATFRGHTAASVHLHPLRDPLRLAHQPGLLHHQRDRSLNNRMQPFFSSGCRPLARGEGERRDDSYCTVVVAGQIANFPPAVVPKQSLLGHATGRKQAVFSSLMLRIDYCSFTRILYLRYF